jgi:prolyl oligopeptidase
MDSVFILSFVTFVQNQLPIKMKKLLLLALLPVLCFGQYPTSKKTPQTITRFGITYTDDYTWFEAMRSPEVIQWIKEQNKVTNSHLGTITKSVYALPHLRKYNAKTNFRIPHKNRKYYYARFAEENGTASFGYKKSLDDYYVKLVDPNYIYSGKTVDVIGYEPSVNSKVLAYKLMINGSDQYEVRFAAIDGKKCTDILPNIKFSSIAWKGDEGVFYNKNSNKSQFALDSTYQVYYHKLGTDVATDQMIYDASAYKGQVACHTSYDGTRLFLSAGDRDEKLVGRFYADLTKEKTELVKFPDNVPKSIDTEGYVNGKIYYSSKESNWGDVRCFTLDNPADAKVVIPQYMNQLLYDIAFFENRIVCKYRNTDGSYFMIFDYNGTFIKKIQVQKGMEVNLTDADFYDTEAYFYVTSYTIPPILFKLNVTTGEYDRYLSNTHLRTTAPFPVDYFETKTLTYTSRDGAKVPMTIVYKKGLQLNGNNPTLLEAYGGFGTTNTPKYDNGIIYFINNGGVYAYAGVRGGGDKGSDWHKNGAGLKKINTLNDFIDGAQYLIDEGYTNPNRLGITGASQGGLLVGSALVQHPELFKVAIPKVGVYDMANFHKYTVGRFHYDEYGDPETAAGFKAMMEYSPLHNIKDDVNYPTTLIITSDNDDRVPPVHSYKFAARLQNRAAQTNPVYLKTHLNAGHYGVTTGYEDELDDESDFYSFLMYHLTK